MMINDVEESWYVTVSAQIHAQMEGLSCTGSVGFTFFVISRTESHYLMSNKQVLVTKKDSNQNPYLSHQVPNL